MDRSCKGRLQIDFLAMDNFTRVGFKSNDRGMDRSHKGCIQIRWQGWMIRRSFGKNRERISHTSDGKVNW